MTLSDFFTPEEMLRMRLTLLIASPFLCLSVALWLFSFISRRKERREARQRAMWDRWFANREKRSSGRIFRG